jgi:hypothetical protein
VLSPIVPALAGLILSAIKYTVYTPEAIVNPLFSCANFGAEPAIHREIEQKQFHIQ